MSIKQLIIPLLLAGIFSCQAGQIVTDGFESKFVPPSPDAPPGNTLRLFNVYLPPTFFTDPTATFPIVYHLTGFGGNFRTYSQTDKQVMDQMLAAQQVIPMIIVAPDPRVELYNASFWVDSVVNGQFEKYIVQELIPYVDAKYRQKKSPSGEARFFRALMGQSMGGYGSLFYGIKHSELFNAYAGDSPTSFWVITSTLATPTDNVMYSFNKLLLPELDENDGVLTPQNGDITFGFFAWAAAFSPNPSRPFLVDYPFVVDDTTNMPLIVDTPEGRSFVPVPEVIARWDTFDPYVFLDTSNLERIRRQSIYLDAGDDPVAEIIDNVGAHYFSSKLSRQFNIKNEYVLFKGGHTSCTTEPEIECYRFRTNLQTFSAKFSENGLYADDIRTKITGTMTLEFRDNSEIIADKKLVGIETDPTRGIALTNITIALFDSARLEIGTSTTLGGGLQVGNPFGKANFVFDPTLLTHRVLFTLVVSGPQATVQIGRQGFLGFGVGINGNQTAVPNYWGVSSLTNLSSVTLNFEQGKFLHNQIASSATAPASLLALGDTALLAPSTVTAYNLSFSPNSFTIAGGGNLAKIVDANLMHPTVLTTAGVIDQGGIRNSEVIVPDPNHFFDEFYGPPKGAMGSETFYTNQLQVSIMASGQMLRDTRKNPLSANATLTDFFNFLSFDPYLVQGTKRAAFNSIDGNLTVGYLPTAPEIARPTVSATASCTPLSPSLNISNVIAQGAIGIKQAIIDGKPVILRLYDLDPPG